MKVLHQYTNGNVDVTIYEDGTKIREWEGDQYVEYPESCDLKITQYCDLDSICVFCHEMSNKDGKHGDLDLISKIWASQPAGTELAIGGGNPLAHPELSSFLFRMSRQGICPNLTINSLHLKKFSKLIRELQEEKCFYGMGISYRGAQYMKTLPLNISYDNAVFHMILGINDFDDCKSVIDWCKENHIKPKLLLLGYKQFGRGIDHYSEELQTKIDQWKFHLVRLMALGGITLSFDNLAIKQLDLQKYLKRDEWDSFYLGDDGTHTFYVDAIKQEVARTSTSETRYKISEDDTTVSIFNKVKQ